MNHIHRFFLALSVILLIVMFGGLLSILVFSEQDIVYNANSLNCDQIRECILLDTLCIEYIVKNSLLWMEWDVEGKFNSHQKDYYKIECLNKDAYVGKVVA